MKESKAMKLRLLRLEAVIQEPKVAAPEMEPSETHTHTQRVAAPDHHTAVTCIKRIRKTL